MALINYDLIRWPYRKWILVLTLILLVHLAVLWRLTGGTLPRRTLAPPLPLAALADHQTPTGDWQSTEDTTLFAGAHPRGFSGVAWVKKPRRSYALEIRLPELTYLHASSIRNPDESQLPAPQLAGKAVARSPGTALTAPEGAPKPGKSSLRQDGDLRLRSLRQMPSLPIQIHDDAVGWTEVETGVDADGAVLVARVTNRSGSRAADEQAVAIARGLKFAPLSLTEEKSPGTLTWGKLIFEWFAVSSAGTNAPAK